MKLTRRGRLNETMTRRGRLDQARCVDEDYSMSHGKGYLNLAIKGGGRPTRLLPHAKMLLIPMKLFLSAG